MLVYWLLWICICISSVFFNVKTLRSRISFTTFFFILFLFIGFRYQVGGDWFNYIEIYDNFRYVEFFDALLISDPAYSFINYISQNIGFESLIFVNTVCGGVICLFLYLSFKILKQYWIMLLIYYPYHILSVSLGYTRQSVALAILTYALSLLVIQKQVLYYILLVIFAGLFHKTAVIFIVVVPFVIINRKYIIFIYTISSMALVYFLFNWLLFDESGLYREYLKLNSAGVFMRLSMHILPLIFYFMNRSSFKEIDKQALRILDYFVLLIGVSIVFSVNFSTVVDRLNLYLIFFDLYVISFLSLSKSKHERFLYILMIIIYNTLFIFIWLFYGEWAVKAWIPYSNYIWIYITNIF